jgi:N-acetylglucosamine-6-sulfatase
LTLLGLAAAALGTLPGRSSAADAPARPNIVFVLMDDLRWDDLGCAGHPFVRTPHVDRIAREGALFRNAFATTPLCSPSRASFLTGLYAHRHGITDNTDRSALSRRLVTFPRLLHDAGYETAFIGKWHMGVDDAPRPGFDHWVGVPGQGTYRDPELNVDGKRVKVAGYTTDVFTDRALAFLKRERVRPFLLYLAHKAVHPELAQGPDGRVSDPGASTFLPALRHKKLYAGAPVPRRPNVKDTLEGKPALQRKVGDLPPLGMKTGTSDEAVRDRLRLLAAVDEGVGRIFKALEEAKQLDNTLIVFTSDHGYFYGEHGLSVERRLAYEEAIRIPLLMRYPRLIKPGTKPDGLSLSVDLAPTLLDLAGVGPPRGMHGRSLVPLLKGEETDPRRSFLIEYFSDTVFPRVHKMGYRAVRTGRWKYIRYAELEGMDELYDLKNDPYEMKNMIKEPGAREALGRLKGELGKLLKETR